MPRTSEATKRANSRAVEAAARAYEAMRHAERLATLASEAFERDGIRDCSDAWQEDAILWGGLIAQATEAGL